MKELYLTGDWICVVRDTFFNIDWQIVNFPGFTRDESEYKLIHKQHSDALDHVLNGGGLLCTGGEFRRHIMYLDDFMKTYDESLTYEIIETEQSVKDKYCLSTKEHYDRLIEDGHEETDLNTFPVCKSYGYIRIHGGRLIPENKATCNFIDAIPTHLHNGSWVEGSLAHGATVALTFEDAKPMLSTTRRGEMLQLISDCRLTSLGELAHGYAIYESVAINLINELCDLLEANQNTGETK